MVNNDPATPRADQESEHDHANHVVHHAKGNGYAVVAPSAQDGVRRSHPDEARRGKDARQTPPDGQRATIISVADGECETALLRAGDLVKLADQTVMMVPNDRALGRSIVEGHMEARFPFPNFELSSDLTQGDWVDIIASALGRPSVAFPIKFEDERTPPIDFVLRRGEETTLVLQQHEVDDEGGGEVVLGSLDAIRGLATLLNGILQDPTGAPGMDIADLRVHSTNTTIGPVT